jgi:hypothetical protein
MSRLDSEGNIIDRIYEAAVLPELWVNVLDLTAHLAVRRRFSVFG